MTNATKRLLTAALCAAASVVAGCSTSTPSAANVDPTASTVAVSPNSLLADGSSSATITVTLRDSSGAGISGLSVNVDGDSLVGADLHQPTALTDSSGATHGSITATQATTVNLSASVITSKGNVPLTGKAAVTFVPTLASLDVGVNPSQPITGAQATLSVRAIQADGTLDTSYLGTITITSDDGSATLPNPYVFTAANAGQAAFTGLVLQRAGATQITASDTAAKVSQTISVTVNAPTDTQAPSGLTYATPNATYLLNQPITNNVPSISGGVVTTYQIAPQLPAGLHLDATTGIISGTPTVTTTTQTFVVTASNEGGDSTTSLTIQVYAATPPTNLSYTVANTNYMVGVAIAANSPSSSGGAVVSYAISPDLPGGLSMNGAGVITGTPTTPQGPQTYTITASNAGGSTQTSINFAVYPAPDGGSGSGGGSTDGASGTSTGGGANLSTGNSF